MIEDQRPGTVYWIDHYVVGSHDLDRWADFQTKVVGARPQPAIPGQGRFIVFQDITDCCHHGAMFSSEPLADTGGLGKGLPRHGLFIRQEDIDEHLRRLDKYDVPHLDPIRTSAEGDDGISIAWEDIDGNQMEFWAPDRMPEGAMAGAGPLKIGRISHGVYQSRDLQRTADFFDRYCALSPLKSADIPDDTLVLPTVCGARIVYKKSETIGRRTGGWGKLSACHAALLVRDEDFFPNYERMWTEIPDWDWDRETGRFIGGSADLPARTSRHGSPAGRVWYEIRGKGDDWYDWDTNSFHFMSGSPKDPAFAEYEEHLMDWHLPRYMEERGLPVPTAPAR